MIHEPLFHISVGMEHQDNHYLYLLLEHVWFSIHLVFLQHRLRV